MACCKEKLDALDAIVKDRYYYKYGMIFSDLLTFHITMDGALTIVDKTDMNKGHDVKCENCGYNNEVLLYKRPTIYASWDGNTKYKVKAHKMLNLLNFARCIRYIEPSFGSFIHGQCGEELSKFILYHPTENINKYSWNCPVFSVGGDPHSVQVLGDIHNSVMNLGSIMAICCVTKDYNIVLIDTNCEVLDTIFILESEPGVYKTPKGYLKCNGNSFSSLIWTYVANPALNTKPASSGRVFD
jgi:hypothetical protein